MQLPNIVGRNTLSYTLKNLNYSQSISVQVSSYTGVGEGPKSRIMNITTGRIIITLSFYDNYLSCVQYAL